MENESKFEGGILELIGLNFLTTLIIIFSLGIALPWALCFKEGWVVRNTVIDGRRFTFSGTGLGLFGNWIKWWFFTFITLGFYGLWVPIKLEQWKVKNTHMVE